MIGQREWNNDNSKAKLKSSTNLIDSSFNIIIIFVILQDKKINKQMNQI